VIPPERRSSGLQQDENAGQLGGARFSRPHLSFRYGAGVPRSRADSVSGCRVRFASAYPAYPVSNRTQHVVHDLG
jgi:hypothetical protein